MNIKVKPSGGVIGFYEWNLDTMEKFQELVKEAFKEACEFASTQEIYAWVAQDNDNLDSTDIFVSLPLGVEEGEGLDYLISYEDIIHSYINNSYFRKGIDKEEIKRAKALAAKLRKLADELDEAAEGDE